MVYWIMKTLTLDEYADRASSEPDEYLIDQFIPYPGRVLLIGERDEAVAVRRAHPDGVAVLRRDLAEPLHEQAHHDAEPRLRALGWTGVLDKGGKDAEPQPRAMVSPELGPSARAMVSVAQSRMPISPRSARCQAWSLSSL